METTTITYQSIRDLALFQEQYDRLTHEIQQVRVQLDSSPALAADDPHVEKREEWRSWLQVQIKSKCRERKELLKFIHDKGFQITELPD
ncbi:hypothetical protein JWJ90_06990 [Desulfobulbus rhabdoformis]|jgi:hypothetical protein|uniref:hypothetical protein n=1 Tax=Desulfobulbus rhabdoformis TaxID=34032 RepID=UPI00196490C2|nr:hypothetical protein [Desulfobulbus rhabdoformis]MBM9614031.1 hypothetical protein [Desulfobulbus rhabdoformis]